MITYSSWAVAAKFGKIAGGAAELTQRPGAWELAKTALKTPLKHGDTITRLYDVPNINLSNRGSTHLPAALHAGGRFFAVSVFTDRAGPFGTTISAARNSRLGVR